MRLHLLLPIAFLVGCGGAAEYVGSEEILPVDAAPMSDDASDSAAETAEGSFTSTPMSEAGDDAADSSMSDDVSEGGPTSDASDAGIEASTPKDASTHVESGCHHDDGDDDHHHFY